MRRARIAIGAALLAALAAGVAVYHASMAADTGVRTIALGTLPWAVAVDAGTGHAFVLDRMTDPNGLPRGAGSMSILDTRSGTILHRASVGPDPRAVATDDRTGRVYVANDDDASVSVLDARDGAVRQDISVGPQPHALALDTRTDRGFVVNTGDGTVSVLDLRRGVALRTFRLDTQEIASIAVDERTGRVLIGGPGRITVLDARSGALVRTIALNGDADQMAVDTRTGRVYVASNGTLSVLDAGTGQVRSVFSVGDTVSAVAVDERRDRIFVARQGILDNDGNPTGPGSVSVLDARSGTVLRTVPVGVAPVALAVDQRTGGAVVVNAGGTIPVANPWSWVPAWIRRHIPWIDTSGTRAVPGGVSLISG